MPTLNIPIATGTDDGQSGTGSGYSATAATYQLGGYFGTANVWMRWLLPIDSGSTITACTVTGNRPSSAGTADVIFRFVKETNPTYPTSSGDYDGRTLTTASVTASYSGTGAWTSADLSTILQEAIDQGGWANNNAVMLFLKDNNSNANHGGFENRIQLQSYENGSNIPTLNVTYTAPAAGQPAVKRLGGVANVHGGYRYGSGQKRWRHQQDNWQQMNGLWLPNNKLVKPDEKLAV
jgi:hypothetical protein